ncbi:protein DJ-1-like protein D [Senna tora]|uniref:Protein DJ-1-like protein D n=1 Tax=Senna tora TaxID=362788 RepID=A0A834TFD8_9FABA|nr:protein DJ-1-like protein D [Senna tora]
MAQKRVLLLCGDYVEDAEAIVPFQALQAYGVAVDAVCPGKKAGDICRTSIHEVSFTLFYITNQLRGHNFKLNATFHEIEATNYDGLVIPGGRSPEYLAQIPSVVELVTQFADSGKPIAALCNGLLILAAAGTVKGRRCTGLPTVRPVLVAAGAHWIEPESWSSTMAVADGNLITAVTFKGHPEYIRLFVKALGGNISGSPKRILFLCGQFMESNKPLASISHGQKILAAANVLKYYMEDYEATVPFQSLQALGCHVDAVFPGIKAGEICPTAVHEMEEDGDVQTYSEKGGYEFELNANFDEVDASSYDGLVIPGGRSPAVLALNSSVIALVKQFMESNKPLASISHGQEILAAANVLKGRKCTAHPSVKLNVVISGGTWVEPEPIHSCFTDGNLVTGASWSGHPQFISQLMALLGLQVSF